MNGLFRPSRRLLLQQGSRHKIVIPPLSSFGSDGAGGDDVGAAGSSPAAGAHEYAAHRHVHAGVAPLLPSESAAELRRAQQVDAFRDGNAAAAEQVWRSSKSHLRKQQKLVEEFGVEGAVRETLQPSTTSFREQLRQRPLDRAILQEIYLGLHGRRIERKLKRGVSWEHWITKGDGTAPVFNTSQKAQQTFAFGGDIKLVRSATHPQHFPLLLRRGATSAAAASPSSLAGTHDRRGKSPSRHRAKPTAQLHPRHDLLPEVAFIGRTSSGKSSLVNAVVNAMITPYGHLRGTTSGVRFYDVAHRLVLVDCPGYGHYDPMMTPSIDTENAVRAMRAYLRTGAAPAALRRLQHSEQNRGHCSHAEGGPGGAPADAESNLSHRSGSSAAAKRSEDADHWEEMRGADADAKAGTPTHPRDRGDGGDGAPMVYQPRNLKRVFLCASAQGLQHLDYAYCDLLEKYQIPFCVVLTKTDAAPIRHLARLTDFTRSQLVRYTQCKEMLLTSSLRIAGIDKVQELLGSLAAADDPLHGATTDFSSIV